MEWVVFSEFKIGWVWEEVCEYDRSYGVIYMWKYVVVMIDLVVENWSWRCMKVSCVERRGVCFYVEEIGGYGEFFGVREY